MRHRSWIALAVGAVLLQVAVVGVMVGGFADAGVEQTAGVANGPMPPPTEDGLVVRKNVNEGFGFFGWRLSSPSYELQIAFVPPPGCADSVPSEHGQIVADGDCFDVAFEGTVINLRADGDDSVVTVLTTVGESCFNATTVGTAWLPLADVCAP